MALKADRIHVDSQIDFFMNEVAERGGIVSVSTEGSGAAMDQAAQLCTYGTGGSTSGIRPLGILMCDMVSLDLTRQHENWHKEEVQIGGKVTIWNKCTVVTNRIDPGVTPTAGQAAYLGPSGLFSNTIPAAQSAEALSAKEVYRVGRFLSTKDEDGYAKVSVNLP
jgi:hypothetical protein